MVHVDIILKMARLDLKIFVSEDGSLVNLYHLLGIESDAEDNDIKNAYHKKLLLCHPDKVPNNPDATELYHQITKACDILLDKEARIVYDLQLQNQIKENKIKEQTLYNQTHEQENTPFLLVFGIILAIITLTIIIVNFNWFIYECC